MERRKDRASIPSRRPRQSLRYSARYLLLTYSKTPERFDALEIQRLASQEHGQCTIVRQVQRDNTFSYLAFVDFAGKRFQTRNLGLFDIQGIHPKWSQVRSSPWDTLDDMMEGGEVIWNGIVRCKTPSVQNGTPQSASKSKSTMQWEHLGSSSKEEDILALCKQYIAAEEPRSSAVGFEQSRDRVAMSEIFRVMDLWRDGYRAGYSDGLAHHAGALRPNMISQFDSDSVRVLSEINQPSQHLDLGTEKIGPHNPIDEMLDMASWSPDEIDALDWESTDFFRP